MRNKLLLMLKLKNKPLLKLRLLRRNKLLSRLKLLLMLKNKLLLKLRRLQR